MYDRGAVVKGPDLFGDYDYRPYVCLSDDTHPFGDEEALYTAATTTRRAVAIPLSDDDFETGGLPHETYVNPWTVVSIRHADIQHREGHLVETTTEEIAREAAGRLSGHSLIPATVLLAPGKSPDDEESRTPIRPSSLRLRSQHGAAAGLQLGAGQRSRRVRSSRRTRGPPSNTALSCFPSDWARRRIPTGSRRTT